MLINTETCSCWLLSNAVEREVVKKTEYNELVKKVNAIDTGGSCLKKQIMIIK